MIRTFLRGVLPVLFALALPVSAFAQASIAGSTRDTSGAALPGVTVEAASPALIEKVRTAVTDDRGVYRIVNLPPGTYTVTFALPGFNQGAPRSANWNAPVALVSAALGRPAAVAGTTVPISLVQPGEVWGERVNALDLRFAKILRFGRVKYNVGLDVINATNADTVLTYNQTFNPAITVGSGAWLAPTSVLTPRFVKVGAQIDF